MPTILVIDDDKNYFDRFLERYLTVLGFCVFGVRNTEQGLEFSKNIRPDLIMVDWCPKKGFSGEETLRSFKSQAATENIPVVVISAVKRSHEDELLARRAGAAQFITRNEIPDAAEDNHVLARRLQALIPDKKLRPPRPARAAVKNIDLAAQTTR